MSAGNPTRAMELVHDLVARHVIVHENGLWILPSDFTNQVAPASLADAFALRIDSLSEHARHMAEILSVCAERLPLELFVRVAGGDRALSFRALDEMVMAHVIVGGLATYDFAQEGFREALLRALPRARRRAIHLSLGEAFLARGVERPVRKVQAGFHLLRGGAEVRGAELLVQATLMLGETASGVLDLGPMFVGALEAALAVFEALPLGQKKGWMRWIAWSKREVTRRERARVALLLILAGRKAGETDAQAARRGVPSKAEILGG
jgi:hypothetical protein